MKLTGNFYICFYKNKNGIRLGHSVSNKNDFSSKLPETIEIEDQNRRTPRFNEIFRDFCRSMNGYMDMLPFIAMIGPSVSYIIREKDLKDFCKKHAVEVESSKSRDIYEVSNSWFSTYMEIDLRMKSGDLVSTQIPRMLLMGVVSSLDYHLAQLMREVIRKKPHIITLSKKDVSVSDIFLANNIDEFKDMMIEREIDSATRESFEVQIDWFEKNCPIESPIKRDYARWSEIVETIERRNLFAHASGIVNSRYLKKINVDLEKGKLKPGDELFAGEKYFESSLDNICEFGVMLSQVVWRKLEPGESEQADDALGSFGFMLIERGEYKLAIRVLSFACGLRGKKDEARRRVDIVNLANAYRLDGDVKRSEEILSKEDWNIVSDKFAVSVAAVRGDKDAVVRYMHRMAQTDELSAADFEEWPVFFHVRDDKEFIVEFEKSFGRPYAPAARSRKRIFDDISNMLSSKDETKGIDS